ncbi:MAG: NifU family protein [Flavobacteriaceae bacterium]|nr:NifU family protein [Flavobacteriaceae bacterium]
MNINIEKTPEKHIIKFVFPYTLVEGSYEISNLQQAKNIPIAQSLLQLPIISSVFITANFIAVQKKENTADWEMIQDDLKELIADEMLASPTVIIQPQQVPISVYVEITPNNSVRKFVTNKILVQGIIELKNAEESAQVPLGQYLFDFPYVKEIFISENFISITKTDEADWDGIAMELRFNISEYLRSGKEISNITNFSTYKPQKHTNRDLSETEKKIKTILDEYVLPAVSGDGGNIDLISFDEQTKTAVMLLQGACSGCPSSALTLKSGIENLLREMMPDEVEFVEAWNG